MAIFGGKSPAQIQKEMEAKIKRAQAAGQLPASASTPTSIAGKLEGMAGRFSESGGSLYDYGAEGIKGFDAGASYKEFLGGARSVADESISKRLEALQSSSAAAGRLNVGTYDKERGDVVRDVERDYANTASGAALHTAGLQLGAYGQAAGHGTQREELGADVLAGTGDRLQAIQNAEEEKRRRKRSGIGSALGGLAGAAIGGTLGQPLLGAQLGSKLGGTF